MKDVQTQTIERDFNKLAKAASRRMGGFKNVTFMDIYKQIAEEHNVSVMTVHRIICGIKGTCMSQSVEHFTSGGVAFFMERS